MKQSILILMYAFFPFENANTNVMLPILEALRNLYEISIVTENRDGTGSSFECIYGFKVYRYPRTNKYKEKLRYFSQLDLHKDRKLLERIAASIIKRLARIAVRLVRFRVPEYEMLKDLLKNQDFALVMSTCVNFASHLCVLRYKEKYGLRMPWIAFYMDPYAYYIGNLGINEHMIQEEIAIYKSANGVLVTDEIYIQNHLNAFSSYLHKTHPVKFANLRLSVLPRNDSLLVSDRVNCFYVGSMIDESVRSPSYLYRMIRQMSDRYLFHFICTNFYEEDRVLRDKLLGDCLNVRWYFNLALDECKAIMASADILLNLGNKCDNQLPSKVLDYISTGRPIVNFFSATNDTSKRFLSNYPNKLNIFEDEDKLMSNIVDFCDFVNQRLGKVVPVDELRRLYKEYDPANAIQHTLGLIERLADAAE